MQTMRLLGTIAACVALAGCSAVPGPTSSGPAAGSPVPTAVATDPATASSLSPSSATALLPLSGELVSQGAETTGTVTISATSDTEFTIALSNFSTDAGDDLRLWLSEGELVQGDDGFYYVAGDAQLELAGTIDPSDLEQSFVFPISALSDWDVRAFTVYDYANRTALGSAALD